MLGKGGWWLFTRVHVYLINDVSLFPPNGSSQILSQNLEKLFKISILVRFSWEHGRNLKLGDPHLPPQ